MKTKLIYGIITLLLLSSGVAYASINNDTLFTSPNENTALVQQFIDSLESVDMDYIVHVKKIDNSTSQTLYSNYILWAKLFVKDTNKYGVKELDRVDIISRVTSISGPEDMLKVIQYYDLFKVINSHQRTLFGATPLQTIEYMGNSDCKLDIVLRKRDKKIEFTAPCNLDFSSVYYEKLSKTLYYPIYILLKKSIYNYVEGYDFYLNKDVVTIKKLNDELEEYVDYKERINEFIHKILEEDQKFNSPEFKLYLPLANYKNIESIIIDSLCNNGIDDIIIYSDDSYWSKSEDTTHRPSGNSNYIIWREDADDYIKVIKNSKYFISTTIIIKNEIFRFLDINFSSIINSNVLFLNGIETSLGKEIQRLIRIEDEIECEREMKTEYPISIGDTIIVYGKKIAEKTQVSNWSSDGITEDYCLYFNNEFIKYTNYNGFDSKNLYLYNARTNSPYYSFELLIDKFRNSISNIDIYFKDCKVNTLDNSDAKKKYWLNEIEAYRQLIKDVDYEIESIRKDIDKLQSENKSK